MTHALLDTNVIVAAVTEAHQHHQSSVTLLNQLPPRSFAVAAHSFAEAYSVLTRPAITAPFRMPAAEVWAALESVAAVTQLIGLSHGQTYEAVREFAASGGIGARLYDKLIGAVAVHHGITCIITWNIPHMRSLFPALQINTPSEYIHGR